jgi:hypothetical protein
MFPYIFSALCIVFLLALVFGDEIRFYRLMTDKKKYWAECFPRYVAKLKRDAFKITIGLAIIFAALWVLNNL